MKANDLMSAMEQAHPEAIEAAAPSVPANAARPDVSDVLGRIREEQTDGGFRAPTADRKSVV